MYDFIAVGDIVSDAFIKLKDASVNCDISREHCTISMPFGEKIPYESVTVVSAVGNSPNAAVSAARLGLKSALVTNIGDDAEGVNALSSLNKEGVSTELIYTHHGKKTNYHYVLWYESDRTILVKHEEYAYELPEFEPPKWLYLSSLGANTIEYHKKVTEYLEAHKAVQLAFQPGTFQISQSAEFKEIYKSAKIVFLNVAETERVLGIATLGISELLKRMRELGPEIVVITDGPKGAYAYDGQTSWFQPPYPDPKAPFERTGAGDAFASTTVAALALGKDLPTALSWGAVNSMSVVQEIGAQKGLLTQAEIEQYLKSTPAEFKTRVL